MKSLALSLVFSSLLASPIAAQAGSGHQHHGAHSHGAHQHGVARLEVAVDGGTLTLHLESPLDNVVGFEHAPKTDKQRAAANQALATLKQADRLFVPTPEAACKLIEATVEAPVLEGKTGQSGEHGDLHADYRFQCAQPARLKGVDVRLFGAFPGMKRVDAALVTAKGQKAFKLGKKLHYMNW
jgi:hypothetical protein